MPLPPALPPAVTGTADDAEQRFYEALQRGDLAQLMACWLEDDEVSCVHPGGPRIQGWSAVRAAFDAIFAHGTVDVHLHEVRRLTVGDLAVHAVVERVEVPTADGMRSAWVHATNVWVCTEQGWRLTCHHASPGSPTASPATGGASGGPVLH
jgi:ketosteroid isomerase-like protein